MKRLEQGFTLIELMIVVAIIGILAAVAIPSYQDYTARAQVTEGMSLTSQFKTPLAEYFADNGSFPPDIATLGGGTTQGKYVASITFTGVSGSSITVQSKFAAANVNSQIKSETFAIATTDGGKTWQCGKAGAAGASTSVAQNLVPAACR
jgi:type IV pilus assembly protein PilA